MAMRKPRTNTRLTAKSSNHYPGVAEREEDGVERGGKSRKRKLSDMLGPQWSKDDLEVFYQAYRKHGKDWKKVAGSMHKRTMEMVEAMYGMNRAYLSLPEGVASSAGLIAMMTDHYNIMDDSEEESSEEPGGSDRSQQMQPRFRTRAVTVSTATTGPSGYGGPSPAKKPRSNVNRPWGGGKRTPRYPAANNAMEQQQQQKGGSNKVGTQKNHQEESSDEENDVTKEAEVGALTLVTASQEASSPMMISKNTPSRKNGRALLQNGHAKEPNMKAESGFRPKQQQQTASSGSGGVGDGSPESKENRGRGGGASTSAVVDDTELAVAAALAEAPASGSKSKSKRLSAKKPKLQSDEAKSDEPNEQSSQSGIQGEEGDNGGEGREENHNSSAQKMKQPWSQRPKKPGRQLFSGDAVGLDALATLAAFSLNGLLPSPTLPSDCEKEQDITGGSESILLSLKGSVDRNSTKESEKREQNSKGHEGEKPKEQTTEKEDARGASGAKPQSISPQDSRKRKKKTATEKSAQQGKSGAEEQGQDKVEPQVPPPKVETPVVLKPRRKPKGLTTAKTVSKQGLKVNKATGDASGSVDLEHSTTQQQHQSVGQTGVAQDEGALPLKLRSKKKVVAEKSVISSTTGCGDANSKNGLPADTVKVAPPTCLHATAELGPFSTKAQLIHCLSPKVRRWCMYEWFYSAIDFPWFADNEFVKYLHHAGLGHVPRLTRFEWGVIRSSLGKPRRLSKNFLREEREKLATYREDVRSHYHELRSGIRDGLYPDLARPLTVGQRVIARHPKTRQIHDGSILTVDRTRCRVQFDRPELGVEFVMDIDAMPIHPLDNMPELMRRKRIILDTIDHRQFDDSKVDAVSHVAAVTAGGVARAALNERLERPGYIPDAALFSQAFLNHLTRAAQANTVEAVRVAKLATNEAVSTSQQALIAQAHVPGQSQARDIDVRAFMELSAALIQKEPLVAELRRLDECPPYEGSETLQRQYSTVALQVKNVNDKILDILKHLRLRNSKGHDGVTSLWHRGGASQPTMTIAGESAGGLVVDGGSQSGSVETGSGAGAGAGRADVAASSRKHAREMVSVAVQSISALKEGEDPLVKIGGALDLISKGPPLALQNMGSGAAAIASDTPLDPATAAGAVKSLSMGGGTQQQQQPLPAVANAGETDKSDEEVSHRSLAVAGDTPAPKIEDAVVPSEDRLDLAFHGDEDRVVVSELMSACVATLLMVQTLTERQLPATDVAHAFNIALESLRPRSVKNLCIFKDIEQELGFIKAQILGSPISMQSGFQFPVDAVPIAQPNHS